MQDDREAWVQLATRMPKNLHRQMKLHCVVAETSVMDFVVGAIEEKLARETKKPKAAPKTRRPAVAAVG